MTSLIILISDRRTFGKQMIYFYLNYELLEKRIFRSVKLQINKPTESLEWRNFGIRSLRSNKLQYKKRTFGIAKCITESYKPSFSIYMRDITNNFMLPFNCNIQTEFKRSHSILHSFPVYDEYSANRTS